MQDPKYPLGRLIRQRRQALGLSVRQLAELSRTLNNTTVLRIESGGILTPQLDTMHALAEVLDMPVADLFAAAGWLPAGELPALQPYLRAKYRDFDDQAIADLEAYAERLRTRGASDGPQNYEDETP